MTMSACRYSVSRQWAWARGHGVPFNHLGYVEHLDQNLFQPLGHEALAMFGAGHGHELHGQGGHPGHMYSLRSSSAAAVNVFHYWLQNGQFATAAHACGGPSANASSIHFEAQHTIDPLLQAQGAIPPNLDVEIRYGGQGLLKATAFECKLTEPYCSSHTGIRHRYLEDDLAHIWEGLPNLLCLARQLSPDDALFTYLNAPQLIKHVLGLKHSYGKKGYWLVYLWNSVPGPESVAHAAEVARFKACAEADGVRFRSLEYQTLIGRLIRHHRQGHEAYVDYLAARYL